MPPRTAKKPVPKGRHTTLHVRKLPRVEWTQKIWEDVAADFAKRQVQYEQGGGSAGAKPSFNTMFIESMAAVVPIALHRSATYITGISQTPKYFSNKVAEVRKQLLYRAPASPETPVQVPAPANEILPPTELEGIEELLRRTAENQERLEAKMEDGRRYQENLYLVLEAVLTAPSGQAPEMVLKQPEVIAAIKAMEKPEVIVAGIPPKHEERIMRQYGSRMKLRIFPVGGTRKLQEVNALNRVEHIVCASEMHGAGLERVMKERGYKKHLLRAGGMTDVRRTLDTILSNPESLYQQQH